MADYQAHLEQLNALGIAVMAFSTDTRDKAEETVTALQLTFPVGYGLTVPADAERIGAAWEAERRIIQPSEFLLGPQGRVLHSTYSTGPVGRINVNDLLRLVGFLEQRRQRTG